MHNHSFFEYRYSGGDDSSDCDFPPLHALDPQFPLQPLLALEIAAQEEEYALRRDKEIAGCFGIPLRRVTALRQSDAEAGRLSWKMLHERLLDDGPRLLAEADARRQAREDARLRRLADGDTETDLYYQTLEPLPPLSGADRACKSALDFCSHPAFALSVLASLALHLLVSLAVPGGWLGLWADMTGVSR